MQEIRVRKSGGYSTRVGLVEVLIHFLVIRLNDAVYETSTYSSDIYLL